MDELVNVMLIAEQLYTMYQHSAVYRTMSAVEEGVPGDHSSVGVLSYVGGYSLLLGLICYCYWV